MNRQNSNDFDVITGPSTASACPVVETMPGETMPASSTTDQAAAPETAEPAAA